MAASNGSGVSNFSVETRRLESQGQMMDELAASALQNAKRLGADAAQIATSISHDKRIVVENRAFTLANSVEDQKFSVVVHKDHKKGSASTNAMHPESLDTATRDALSLASFSLPDEALGFANTNLAPRAEPLRFLYDDAVAKADLGELRETMQEVLATLTRDPRVALDRFEMGLSLSRHSLVNSFGVAQAEAQTLVTWGFMGMAVDGDTVSGMDYDDGSSYTWANHREQALEQARRFVERVLKNLHPRKCPSYKGPVVLSPRAVHELILDMLLFHLNGRSVMDGKSRWGKDALGTRVVSPHFTLADDPHDRRLAGCSAFDSDGVPTRRALLIDSGVLQQHLLDVYSARRLGLTTNGEAGGPFGLHLAPGTKRLNELLKDYPQILLVDRFSGNSDPITGDFSGVAKSSRLYVGGSEVGAVGETMIAGNVFDVAAKLLALSVETEIVSGRYESPYLVADGFAVTGQGS